MSKYTTQIRWICETAYDKYIDTLSKRLDQCITDNKDLYAVLFNQGEPKLKNILIEKLNLKVDELDGFDFTVHDNRLYCEYDPFRGYDKIEPIIEQGRLYIFDKDYPIYKQEHKKILEDNIIRHYYTREIGDETVGLFKLKLWTKMNEIMPYYNKLYESTELEFNPLYDSDYYDDYTDSRNSNGTYNSKTNRDEETSNTSKSISKYNDTPQGGLDGIETNKYLTNATIAEATGSGTGNTSSTSGSESENTASTKSGEHIYGKRGTVTYSKLIEEYRDAIINVDRQIIRELRPLFFTLW